MTKEFVPEKILSNTAEFAPDKLLHPVAESKTYDNIIAGAEQQGDDDKDYKESYLGGVIRASSAPRASVAASSSRNLRSFRMQFPQQPC